MSQEFKLPEVIQLWDFFFADPNRFEFLHFFCCAMLVFVRDELLRGDFGANLSLLQVRSSNFFFFFVVTIFGLKCFIIIFYFPPVQNYPIPDIDQVIQKAFELKDHPPPQVEDTEEVEE